MSRASTDPNQERHSDAATVPFPKKKQQARLFVSLLNSCDITHIAVVELHKTGGG